MSMQWRGILSLLLCLVSGAVLAQASPTFQPSVGQEGKDVIWVPTPPALVTRMLQLAQVGPKDVVIDLGSGDGRIAIAAAKEFGAEAMGIEFNPDMVALSNKAASAAGVAAKVKFVRGDIFEADFSRASVVTMYLLSDLNLRLRPKILGMKPGTRVVSHQFTMGDWPADETSYIEGRPAYFWLVPAKVDGVWSARIGADASRAFALKMDQTFQKISGSATFGKLDTTLREATLRGDWLRFSLIDPEGKPREFAGRVAGNRITGDVLGPGVRSRWEATRN
jgi:SAM-dependent methyltransferase